MRGAVEVKFLNTSHVQYSTFRTSRGSHPAVGVGVPTGITKYNRSGPAASRQ
jgi:hypothetical protein